MSENSNSLEDYISMEEYAIKNCPRCINRKNCFYEINKRTDGNAICVYFAEEKNEQL